MAATMKALIASDGSACADAALDDLKRAGLPGEAEVRARHNGQTYRNHPGAPRPS
jgi:hypothetical protein